ncbi:hypothetical protein BK666_19785 [Pseudomonas frederiksbergensis]|uniref:Uncharacterized protein n=1 Tax=Pseudomonas frederiksbergensis TaxID=104087 RepID=A0A423JZB1_9PSED|nr:hypothetical protein [Pseudomonas frederiksbergensis]RON43333.1 hypothetical protein BK666_19785 [Pseudomonas frederiksbergensis]
MSSSSTLGFIKHHIAVFLIVGGTFAGAAGAVGAWLWSEFKDLQQQSVEFEQRKSKVAEAESTRKQELVEREYAVRQAEAKNTEREESLKARELQYQRSSEQLKLDQQSLSAEQGEKAAERQLQSLMSEFSALGVDLNANPYCGSQANIDKFNSAVAKYSEIAALAQAHSLEKKYRRFLTSNEQHSFSFGCYKVEHIKSPAT